MATKGTTNPKGDDLRNRLAASLQTVHGFQSEKLIEYGIKPRRPRGRDRQARKRRTPAAAPAPAGTTT